MNIVKNWEKSWNGDGSLKEEEKDKWVTRDVNHEDFGKYNKELYVGDHQTAFLGQYETVCLYVWHMIDQYDDNTDYNLHFKKDQGATNNDVQVIEKSGTKRGREGKDKDENDWVQPFVSGLNKLGFAELHKEKCQ